MNLKVVKKRFLSWLKILLLINSFYPQPLSLKDTYNESGYIIEIDDINLHIYFSKDSTLDDGLE